MYSKQARKVRTPGEGKPPVSFFCVTGLQMPISLPSLRPNLASKDTRDKRSLVTKAVTWTPSQFSIGSTPSQCLIPFQVAVAVVLLDAVQ